MNFFIKKDSTLPELTYRIEENIMERYGLTDDMLQSVAVTFSMVDMETGLYVIANKSANISYEVPNTNFMNEYVYKLQYKFRLKDTKKVGNYVGEFVLDFLDSDVGCGKIKLPIADKINIIISDSITKTTIL